MADNIYNAARLRRRAINSIDGGEPPYKLSRSAQRQIYGQRAVDGSAPHSARDTMGTGVSNTAGGLTPDAQWNRFFQPGSLAPESPFAGAEVAAIANEVNPSITSKPAVAPNAPSFGSANVADQYRSMTMRNADKWFQDRGRMGFRGPYGWGTSTFGGADAASDLGDILLPDTASAPRAIPGLMGYTPTSSLTDRLKRLSL